MSKHTLLILYGSETGTAQDAAERLWRQAVLRCMESRVMAMDDYPISGLIYERLIVFVVATTGNGDPPANMIKSWNFLLRRSLPSNSLNRAGIAVLGLGDSSYVKYNIIAKKLYRRLTDGLGATPLCDLGLADDQHDLGPSAVIDPWSIALWEHIKNKVYSDFNLIPPLKDASTNSIILRWKVVTGHESATISKISSILLDDKSSYTVNITSNERVTPNDHFQDVRLIKMKCFEQGRKFSYSPGDVAYITPANTTEAVDKFFTLFEENKFYRSTVVTLEQLHKGMYVPVQITNKSFTLENCVSDYWDLNVIPARSVFEVMASVSQDELEREKLVELSSPEGTQSLYDYCYRPRRTILEVLADFPHSCSQLKLEHMFDLMKIIRPRAFSIASSPLEDELMVLVAVVNYRTRLKAPRLGLCSNWLKNLSTGTNINVTIKKGSLRFPSYNLNEEIKPVIMVGPGTGVAPFRSYIMTEHLTESSDKRPLTLYFGCRNRGADFFFCREWPLIESLKVFTAFSRDQPEKIYVQHVILGSKDHIADELIKGRGHFFVAGSSKDMPQAVQGAVKECLADAGQMTNTEAERWLNEMTKNNQYQQEVWS